MSQILLYLDIEEYLAQWFINDQGGNYPVKLKRGSIEAELLFVYLQKPPKDYVPELSCDESLAIEIPSFKNKDPRAFFYLPPVARQALVTCIRNRFDIEMWKELHKFSSVFSRQDQLILAFMEKHGIKQSDKNWNAVAKRYQRKKNIYKRAERRRKNQIK